MKPQLKTETIRVEYWSCGNPDHRHKTESVAAACIAKAAQKKTSNYKWDRAALAAVLQQFRAGATKADLARLYGLSRDRIGQVIDKAERVDRYAPKANPIDDLTVRTRNALFHGNLKTVEQIRAAVESGEIRKTPNLGAKSLKEVKDWLSSLPQNG